MDVTGTTGGQGYTASNMVMSEYKYVCAFITAREPSGYRSYWKFSKLTLNEGSLSEEIISEDREVNTLNGKFSLSNGKIRTQFVNGNGFSLLFGFK